MEASEPRTIAILVEKPSVAQDIARVLGADKRGKGYLQGTATLSPGRLGIWFPWPNVELYSTCGQPRFVALNL